MKNRSSFKATIPTYPTNNSTIRLLPDQGFTVFLWIIIIIFLFLSWCFLGHISITSKGRGVFITVEGVSKIHSMVEGAVFKISKKEGEIIKPNETIMLLYDPLRQSYIDRSSSLIQTIKEQEAILPWMQADFSAKAILYQSGLISFDELLNSKSSLIKLKLDIESKQINLASEIELVNKTYYTRNLAQEKKQTFQQILQNFSQKIDVLKKPGLIQVQNTTDDSIILTSIEKSEGSYVNPGSILARFQNTNVKNESLYVYAYLDPALLAYVKKGNYTIIEINSIDYDRWGYIVGEIESVYNYPISKTDVENIMPNPEFAEYLMQGHPGAIQVKIKPKLDSQGNFTWSSGQGPLIQIKGGEICEVQVIYQKIRPIDYIMPYVRSFLTSLEKRKLIVLDEKN